MDNIIWFIFVINHDAVFSPYSDFASVEHGICVQELQYHNVSRDCAICIDTICEPNTLQVTVNKYKTN